MFGQLTDQINSAWQHLRGRSRLTEQNIQNALKDVRSALIEADVAQPVVKNLISKLKVRLWDTIFLKILILSKCS